MLITICITFAACSEQKSPAESYEEGYDEGYSIGESCGYSYGYDDGFEEGYDMAELDYFSEIEEYDILESDYNEILQVTLTDLFSRHSNVISEKTSFRFDCVELEYSIESTEYEKQLHYSLALPGMKLSDYYVERQASSDPSWKYWEFSEDFPLSYYGVFYKDNGSFKPIRTSIYGKSYYEISENSNSYIFNNELNDYITIKDNIDMLYIVGCVNSQLYGVTLNLT